MLAAGCANVPVEEPAPASVAQADEEWMLIRPPDTVAALAILQTVAHLPDGDDRLPSRPANGFSNETWSNSQILLREIQMQSDARSRALLLAEQSVDHGAPRDDWQRVRPFNSREKCETTRAELQDVTRAYSQKIRYYENMPVKKLQFLLLASSFALSDCVPAAGLPAVKTS